MIRLSPLAALVACLAAGACAPRPTITPAPDSGGPAPGLPEIPLIDGPLVPRVQYPPPNHLIQARDSNFLHGSLGSGRAALTINGHAVPVLPNGAWIAFLPVPPDSAPRYELVAVRGADTARTTHPVRVLPRVTQVAPGSLAIDSASLTPRGGLALPDGETVRVSVRASAANAILRTAAGDVAMTRSGGTFWAEVPAERLRERAAVVARAGTDSAMLAVPALPRHESRWVAIGGAVAAADTDRVVVARPIPSGTYKWFFLPGTRLRTTARSGDFVRVQLDDALQVWVQAGDAADTANGGVPNRVAANARVDVGAEWDDFVLPMSEPPPYLVEQLPQALQLTLYGTRATTDIIRYTAGDPLVRRVRWEPVASDRVVYTLELTEAPYGHLVMWRDGALVVRVRRAPRVDPDRPLAGITIAVDAGHPPAGATGPTGLYEGNVTLPIAQELQRMLEARGATVVMTRTTLDTLALGARPIIARRANAHALVSVHLNALPDGVNPFTAHGTGTYYFHPASEPMARAVQAGMVRHMGLRDLGTYYDNLALVRPTWMPAVLTEGAFIMMPEQEAALRTEEFRQRYARGVAEGLEAYFRGLAGR